MLDRNNLPRIIIHNSITLDGSLTGFIPNMEVHYRIAGDYRPDAHLIGSNTMVTGIELYGDGVPEENENDFQKPERDVNLPYWVIIDSKGKLEGKLHVTRRFEYCRDVLILVSKETPENYLEYLEERNYDYHLSGEKSIDLLESLYYLKGKYNTDTILTDSGRILNTLLLDMGIVDEISLLVHPIILGKGSYNMFSDIKVKRELELMKSETLEDELVWTVYRVMN